MWSFQKLRLKKISAHIRANSIGCYMLNGNDVIMFPPRTRCEEFCKFLEEIRKLNPIRRICLTIDNYSVHKSKKVRIKARKLNIKLIYLPPYSPDLNPIEYIWKSIKRIISSSQVDNLEELISLVNDNFIALAKGLSFARNWMWQFLRDKLDLFC
jgi:putative transposase